MTLLKVQGLNVSYKTMKGELKAVQGVDFELEEQETLGIVGESACGKSTLGLALLNLVPPPGRVTDGSILLEGEDILSRQRVAEADEGEDGLDDLPRPYDFIEPGEEDRGPLR